MKILLPLDDSKFADKNIEYVAKLAKQMEAEVTLFHAVALPSSTATEGFVPDFTTFEAEAKTVLEKYQKILEEKGLKVSSKSETGFGRPGDIINRELEKGGYDLVALGARGKSTLRNLLLGSVADSVVHNAPCSVLIIR